MLVSAAHNAADSLSSGCALAFGLHDFPFWTLIEALPAPSIRLDLLDGEILSSPPEQPTPEWVFLQAGFRAAAEQMPEFLRRNDCDPEQVARIGVEFQIVGPVKQYEAEITVEQKSGESSRETYVGLPLRRRRVIDQLGRVRKA